MPWSASPPAGMDAGMAGWSEAVSARDDDTELDALSARARSRPALAAEAAQGLIGAARAGDAGAREALVEQALAEVLEAAMARRGRGVELVDLYQEGSMAAVIAVQEYVERRGSGTHLNAYVRRVVEGHLDRMVEREETAAGDATALVRDAHLVEDAQVELRRRGGREPTATELAAALGWATDRVEMVDAMLRAAREIFDAEIVQYLDDEAER